MKLRTLLLFLFVLAAHARAEVTEHLDYVDYPVKADAGGSLLGMLNAASPIREEGQTHHGHTDWQVKWNFRWTRKGGQCRITRVDTEVKGKIMLPRLVGGSAEQRRQFEKYLSALRTHELGHYENGRNAAAEIEHKILSLPEMSSCDALQDAANDAGDKTIDFYSEKDRQYDKTTEYGRTQGAWLTD